MNRRSAIQIALGLSAIGAAFFAGSHWRESMHGAVPAAPVSGTQQAAQATMHACPMHPHIRQHGPGQCPICGMALVPERSARSADDVIEIEQGLIQRLGVRMAEAQVREFQVTLEAPLVLAFDDRLQWVEQTRVAGFVSQLHVRVVGERVRKNAPLAQIYSPEAATALDDHAWLSASGSADLLAASEARLKRLGLSPSMRRADAEPRFTVSASRDGLVAAIEVVEGAAVNAGMPLLRLRSDARLWAMAELREDQIAGDDWSDLRAELSAFPGRSFELEALEREPQLDSERRTLIWRLAVDNAESALKPGMQGLLRASSRPYRVLAVPSAALIVTGERRAVVVEISPGRFRSIDVTPGRERDGYTAIRSGVREGQRVVVSGQFLIDSEASLRRALPEPETKSHTHEHADGAESEQ